MSTGKSYPAFAAALILIVAFGVGACGPQTSEAPAQDSAATGGRGAGGRGGRGGGPGQQQVRPPIQEQLDQMGIVGYADHMTIEPGETIRFMVSTRASSYPTGRSAT